MKILSILIILICSSSFGGTTRWNGDGVFSGSLSSSSLSVTSLKDSGEVSNIGISASVGSNALTIALKQSDGNNCTSALPCRIGFRSSTLTNGTYNQRSITSALSVVVSSGSTLGHTSAVAEFINVYAIDNAGTIELAVSSTLFIEDGSLISTTAEGGAGAADGRYTAYSTTARSSVPVRLIGRILITEATAGTWASSPTAISVLPFYSNSTITGSTSIERIERSKITGDATTPTVSSQSGTWIGSITRNGTGDYSLNLTTGHFTGNPVCSVTADSSGACSSDSTASISSVSTSAVRVRTASAGAAGDCGFHIICMGLK